jgi:beta-lactamase regulating signal transducer with metallopeptidase domain/protocatechuate 3,4-dioxygenase beta subunit
MNEMIPSPASLLDYLLHSGFQASVMVILVLTIQRFFRNQLSPTLRHGLWLLVLLRLSLPQLPSTAFSVFNLTNHFAPRTDRSNHPLSTSIVNTKSPPLSQWVHAPDAFLPPTPVANPELAPIRTSPTEPNRHTETPLSISDSDFSTVPFEPTLQNVANSPQTVSQPSAQQLATESERISPVKFAFGFWLFGVTIIALKLIVRTLQLRRSLKRSSPINDPRITDILTTCQRRLDTRRKVKIRQTDAVAVPSIYGFLRPSILLPNGFIDSFSPAELEYVFTHELAHLKRLDPLWNAWATFLQVLHWPNPIAWYVSKRIRADQELATDYLVLRSTENPDPKAYGETILKTLKGLSQPRLTPGTIGMADDNRNLRHRFQFITDFRSHHRYSIVFVLLLLTSLLLTCLTDAARGASDEETQARATGHTQPDSTRPIESLHSLDVIVRDVQSQLPLPDVPVSYQFGTLPTDVKGWTITDKNGHATLEIGNPVGLQHTLRVQVTPSHSYSAELRTWQGIDESWDQLPQSVEFQLEPGQRIGGTVKDHRNRPIPEATLSLREPWEYRRLGSGESPALLLAPTQLEIKTDGQGRWHFDGIPKQVRGVVLQIKRPNGAASLYSTGATRKPSSFEPRIREGTLIDMDSLLKETSEIALPQGNNIELQIIDPQGNPIEGATITEYFGQSPLQRKAVQTTDRRGQANFKNRSQHELLYVVSHPEHALNSMLVRNEFKQSPHQIVLPAPSPVMGTVSDPDGNPVTGALIILEPDNTVDFVAPWHAVTDKDGTFSWKNAPRRSVAIRAEATGFNPTVVEIKRNHRTLSIPLSSLDRSETRLEIQVNDSQQNTPITRFEYRLIDQNGSTFCNWTEVQGAKTTIQGHLPELYSSLRSRERLYRVEARAPGYYAARSRMLSQREINPRLEFALHTAALAQRMAGTQILDQAGQPKPGANIYLLGNTAAAIPSLDVSYNGDLRTSFRSNAGFSYHTDAQGKLPLMALPAGFRGLVVVGRDGFVAADAKALANVPEALRFEGRNVVEGTLTIGGWPTGNQPITLHSLNSSPPLFRFTSSTEADEKGNFSFPGVPHGKYVLTLPHPTPPPRELITQRTYQKQIIVRGPTPTRVQYTNHGRVVTGQFVSETLLRPIGFSNGKFYLSATGSERQLRSFPRTDDYVSRDSFQRKVAEYHLLEGNQQRNQARLYPLNISTDGRFIADAIPPGNYRLIAELREEGDRGQPFPSKPLAARLVQLVTVAEGDSLTPLDLGTLHLERTKTPSEEKTVPPQAEKLTKPAIALASEESPRTESHRIRVTAKDFITHEGIPNVRISVKPTDAEPTTNPSNTQTDQFGIAFVTVDPSLNEFFLQAEMDGYVPIQKYFSTQKRPWTSEHEFKMEKGKRIHGRVTDSMGTPIPDVEVSISLAGSNSRYGHTIPVITNHPRTDLLGRWHFDGVPPDAETVSLRFLHPQWAMNADAVNSVSNRLVREFRPSNKHIKVKVPHSVTRLPDTVLVPGGKVAGRILDHTNRPLSATSIRVRGTCCSYTTSDSSGNFELPGSYQGEIELLITNQDTAPRQITLYAGPRMSPLDIQLEKGKALIFDIRDSSGSPIQGVPILPMVRHQQGRSPIQPGISTDEHGRGLFKAAANTPMDYYIYAQGFKVEVLTSLLPRMEPYSVTLTREEKTISFNISVRDTQGNPIPDFELQVGHPTELPVNPLAINWVSGQTYQGTDGTFSYRGHHNPNTQPHEILDTYVLKVKAYGYQSAISEPINQQSQTPPQVIILTPSLATLGRLTDSEGRPLANRRLHLFAPNDPLPLQNDTLTHVRRTLKTIKTDRSGRFEIPAKFTHGTLAAAFKEGLAITQMKDSKDPITLRTKGWGSLHGQWVTTGSKDTALGIRPIPQSELARLNLKLTPSIHPDQNGRFTLPHLPEGTYELFYHVGETQNLSKRIDIIADRENRVIID